MEEQMENNENNDQNSDSNIRRGCCRKWLKSPSFYIYINFFLSQWGDWMWLFAVGLYMVHLDGDQLRLAAVFGFTGGTCVLFFGGVIGAWVDRNQRLKVVRISLFVQNLSVALSSVGVCLALIFDPVEPCHENYEGATGARLAMAVILRAAILGLAIVAQLASGAYKIAIEKDWLVEIAEGNPRRLANLNATTRSLDLACKVVAPLCVGLLMTYGSLLISAIFLAAWNIVSVFIEYTLVAHVYAMLPRLATKNVRRDEMLNGREAGVEMQPMLNTPGNSGEGLEHNNIDENFQSSENLPSEEKPEATVAFLNGNGNIEVSPASNHSLDGENDVTPARNDSGETGKKEKSCRMGVVNFLHTLGGAWKAYARQVTLYAGLSLALLYMTVLGFDSITIAYIQANGIEEWKVGLSMGLAGVTGMIGTFFFTRLHRVLSLNTTGLIAFSAEILCLTLCVASVWLPGSRFDLSHVTTASRNQTSGCAVDLPAGSMASDSAFANGSLSSTPSSIYVNVTRSNFSDSGLTATEFPAEAAELNISVLLLLAGIIASRIGLWIADLVVTQLMQEAIKETERGVVNGVQNSLNMLMEMLKFGLVILLPHIEIFGLHIIVSFSFICLAGLFFVGHVIHSRKLDRVNQGISSGASGPPPRVNAQVE